MTVIVPSQEELIKQQSFGRVLDALVSSDIVNRGISHYLYDSARAKVVFPLTTTAGLAIMKNVKAGDVVLIGTGWPSRSWLMKGITETDGPVGAAYLARFLEECLGVIPIIVTEHHLIRFSEVALRAAGLIVADLETALNSKNGNHKASVASVISFTTDWSESDTAAKDLLNQLQPKAIISIEFPGANTAGQFHTATGRVIPTELVAKLDAIFKAATNSGILTVGIGDGGNEIGMANVADAVTEHLKDGSDILPATPVDYLVVGSVSNFGAAGLAAALAALTNNSHVLQNVSLTRITEKVSDAGAIDGLSAYLDPKNDGVPQIATQALMELITTTVTSYLNGWKKK
jgi:D-glutamate cyclase